MLTYSLPSVLGCVLAALWRVPHRTRTNKRKMPKVVVWRTNDEVNADLAQTWCDEHGLDWRPAEARDELFPSDAVALAIDLNHLARGPRERAEYVDRLCRALPTYPVALASYDLEASEKKLLRARGFLVCRCFNRQLFDELGRALGLAFADFAA
jgi:hypothetical protein